LIFEFGSFARQCYPDVGAFLQELDPFLAALPRDFRYAVEIRNPEFLSPEYFACLGSHGVAHVFNAWTRMPPIGVQIAMPGSFTADFTVVRALLRKGRTYEKAVSMFEPYEKVQEPDPDTRTAIRQIAELAARERKRAYVFVNNRLEGNAPQTIEAVVSDGA